MYKFDAKEQLNNLIEWIKVYFRRNGSDETKAVVGLSGGKDSTTVAAACVKALGKDRVIGVLMPDGEQSDIDYAKDLVKHLGITAYTVNIGDTTKSLFETISHTGLKINDVATINTPARIRMSTLYGISGIVGGRVANTCNLSEDWVGYATKFGDGAGDFSPLSHFTVQEVKALGKELGLPDKFINKVPTDGLCGQTDEDKLGFSYEVLDKYIREGVCEDQAVKNKIDKMHKENMHKLLPMPYCIPLSVNQ
jgi:NAD+ synthase